MHRMRGGHHHEHELGEINMRAKKLIRETLKRWTKSKTMTFNGLVIIMIIVIAEGWLGITFDSATATVLYSTLIVPLINMLLRYFTNLPLAQKETLLE
jgi:hypothetical protein